MRRRRFLFGILSSGLIIIYLQFGFCASIHAQAADSSKLYKSAEFTPPNSFTHGVEGPAVDKYGNVYAVNFSGKVL